MGMMMNEIMSFRYWDDYGEYWIKYEIIFKQVVNHQNVNKLGEIPLVSPIN